MRFSQIYFYSLAQAVILILSLFTDWYYQLVIAMTAVTLMLVMDKLGKGIVLRELITLHLTFVCLAMPAIGYLLYNKSHALASLWVRYMPISEELYFPYALPAVSAFSFAICLPFVKKSGNDTDFVLDQTIPQVRKILAGMKLGGTGTMLIVVGFGMYFISKSLPTSLRFISQLVYFSSFAGLLYVFYAPSYKYRTLVIIAFILFILANAINSGMFTIVAYMGITVFSFLFLGNRTTLFRKLLVFVVAISALIVIQSVKPAYRHLTWTKGYAENRTLLFMNILSEKIEKGNFLSDDVLFPIYYRTNQGFNVALVMRRVPEIQPHDGGVILLRSLAASFVPRLFWPDKPEAGGKFNMKYYTGITLEGWSTNIGPMGEGYGAFGTRGGIAFMFVLGLFVRWAYGRVFEMSRKFPLLILWLPVLFYQVTYSAETDTLQIMNYLIKSAVFVWIIFRVFPKVISYSILRKPMRRQVPSLLQTAESPA